MLNKYQRELSKQLDRRVNAHFIIKNIKIKFCKIFRFPSYLQDSEGWNNALEGNHIDT